MKSTVIFLVIVTFAASMALIIPTEDSNSDESKNITSLQAIIGFTLRDPIEIAERLKNIPLENATQIVDGEADAAVDDDDEDDDEKENIDNTDEVNDRLSDSQEVLEPSNSTGTELVNENQ